MKLSPSSINSIINDINENMNFNLHTKQMYREIIKDLSIKVEVLNCKISNLETRNIIKTYETFNLKGIH